MNKLESRIARLETAVIPPKERWLRTFSNQYGLDGKAIREETDDQVIERHLKEHPEDAGMKFSFIERVIIHPTNADGYERIIDYGDANH